jgi:hypothetical protein
MYDYSPKHTRKKPHFETIQTHGVSPFTQINYFSKKAHDFARHIIIAVGAQVAVWLRALYRMDTATAVQYASSDFDCLWSYVCSVTCL